MVRLKLTKAAPGPPVREMMSATLARGQAPDPFVELEPPRAPEGNFRTARPTAGFTHTCSSHPGGAGNSNPDSLARETLEANSSSVSVARQTSSESTFPVCPSQDRPPLRTNTFPVRLSQDRPPLRTRSPETVARQSRAGSLRTAQRNIDGTRLARAASDRTALSRLKSVARWLG